MARPNEPDMLPKRIKKGAIRYLPYPNSCKNPALFFSYRDQSGVLVIWRVNREKNSASILFSNSPSAILEFHFRNLGSPN